MLSCKASTGGPPSTETRTRAASDLDSSTLMIHRLLSLDSKHNEWLTTKSDADLEYIVSLFKK